MSHPDSILFGGNVVCLYLTRCDGLGDAEPERRERPDQHGHEALR